MAETDLIKLYSTRILALAADIPHLGQLDAPDARVKKRAPLCGSSVTVDLRMENGKIAEFAQDVKACALGQSSAAVLGQNVLGRTAEEITSARDALKAMLTENGPTPPAPFADYEVLTAARDFKNRHGSILLALEATVEACALATKETA